MAGLMSKVARLARSPQARRLTERAKRASADPKKRQKIEQLRPDLSQGLVERRLRARRSGAEELPVTRWGWDGAHPASVASAVAPEPLD